MRGWLIFVLLYTLFSVGCKKKKSNSIPPQQLIPTETFSLIMADLYLAEAFGINERAHSFKQTKDQVYPYYKEVLDKYKVNTVVFDSSYNYYKNDPELMLEVLDKARLTLEELKKSTLEEKQDNQNKD